MDKLSYDVIVIGAGSTGENVADRAVKGGLEVRVIAGLLSVNVGLPREITWRGQTVRTAIWKDPVHGRRMARP